MMDDPDFLEHFGVKGMKWGVRTDSKQSSNRTPLSSNQKRVVAGTAVTVGAAATVAILKVSGNRRAASVLAQALATKEQFNSARLFG